MNIELVRRKLLSGATCETAFITCNGGEREKATERGERSFVLEAVSASELSARFAEDILPTGGAFTKCLYPVLKTGSRACHACVYALSAEPESIQLEPEPN